MLTAVIGFLLILLSIGLGILLLAAGRRYYAIFVGLGGIMLVHSIYDVVSDTEMPPWVWLVSLVVGGVAAAIAPRLETLSLRVAGFVLGGYVAVFLLVSNGYFDLHGVSELLLFIVGGLLGLLGIFSNRDEWLITLSSLAGAAIITEVIALPPALRAAAYSGLAAAGMLIQAREWILPTMPGAQLSVSDQGKQD